MDKDAMYVHNLLGRIAELQRRAGERLILVRDKSENAYHWKQWLADSEIPEALAFQLIEKAK